jgi:hypothetical protein
LKLITWFTLAIICMFTVVGIVLYKHHETYKAEQAMWDQKNREFPAQPKELTDKMLVPTAYVGQTFHVLILGPGGKTLMYCEGENKCLFGYGVTPTDVANATNALFMSLAAQQRYRPAPQTNMAPPPTGVIPPKR